MQKLYPVKLLQQRFATQFIANAGRKKQTKLLPIIINSVLQNK